MDEFGRRVASGLKPEPADVTAVQAGSSVFSLDLAGDASELSGSALTDVVYAPVEASSSKLFASNAIAAFGFLRALPFTDIILVAVVVVSGQPVADDRFSQAIGPKDAKKNTRSPRVVIYNLRQG